MRARLEREFGKRIAAWMLRELRRTIRAAGQGVVYMPSDEELARMMLPFMRQAAIYGAAEGTAPLISMGVAFDELAVNQAAVAFAREHVFQGYDVGTAAAINNRTRDVLQREVSAWIAEPGHKQRDLAERLAPVFGPKRAGTIAITEITNAYAGGAVASWRDINRQHGTTIITGKQWLTANDDIVCAICAPLGGLVFDVTAQPTSEERQLGKGAVSGLGDVFVHPGGGGAAAAFAGTTYYRPPAHPRCRCRVVPYIDEVSNA